MPSQHKQSRAKKKNSNHARSHRRKKNITLFIKRIREHNRYTPKRKRRQRSWQHFLSKSGNSMYYRNSNTSREKIIEDYFKAIKEDINIFEHKKNITTMLTQIERQMTEVKELISKHNGENSFFHELQELKTKLKENNFYEKLEAHKKYCERQGFQRNPETGHYIIPTRYEFA